MTELFDPFSLDNQVSYILNTSSKFLPKLCGPNSPFKVTCQDEDIWRHVFSRLTGQTEKTVDDSLIPNNLARTWLEKSRLVYALTNPKKVYTVYLVDRINTTSIGMADNLSTIHVLKNYYNTEGYESAEACIVDDFNNHVEPIYSAYLTYIQTLLNSPVYLYGSDSSEIQLLQDILVRERIGSVDDLRLIGQIKHVGLDLQISENVFFELGNEFKSTSMTLFRYSPGLEPSPVLTVRGDDTQIISTALSLALNYDIKGADIAFDKLVQRILDTGIQLPVEDVSSIQEVLNTLIDIGEDFYLPNEVELFDCTRVVQQVVPEQELVKPRIKPNLVLPARFSLPPPNPKLVNKLMFQNKRQPINPVIPPAHGMVYPYSFPLLERRVQERRVGSGRRLPAAPSRLSPNPGGNQVLPTQPIHRVRPPVPPRPANL